MKPKISVYIAASLDGYIARKDGSIDWLDSINSSNEDCGYHKFFSSIDALILGRKTYETVASFATWPYEGKRVIVLSNTLDSTPPADVYSGNVRQLASDLHTDGVKHIWIDGGITITHFLKAQIVDQIILSIVPIILGSGIPLFNILESEIPCHLVSSQAYSNSLVQLTYEIHERVQ